MRYDYSASLLITTTLEPIRMTTTHALIIPEDREQPLRFVPLPDQDTLAALQKWTGARTVEVVNENALAPDLWVDEEGPLAGRAPNYAATDLALTLRVISTGTYFHVGAYRGTAVLAWVDSEGNTVGLTDQVIRQVRDWASMNAVELDASALDSEATA
ncbi:MAG: hypothetical protein AAGA90_20035 [Actinomycetota bacterium]